MSTTRIRPLTPSRLLLAMASVALAATLSACGKPEPAAAPAAAVAPASPAAAAQAPAAGDQATAAAKPDDKKDAVDPLAHEGVPGLSDLFSKKKEGGGH